MKTFKIWGQENIDVAAIEQMNKAMQLPVTVSGALMGDAHLGYGLPIGGVLATDNAVIPYAVGVDIACRMRLSLFDLDPAILQSDKRLQLRLSLENGTRFGVGSHWETHEQPYHAVMQNGLWNELEIFRDIRVKAASQLGTSGSGNHFVEYGVFTLNQDHAGLPAGNYLALLSHSGSRGAGSAVCDKYSKIAKSSLSESDRERFGDLAWLSLDSEAGKEYWAAMNLMGEYAAANHELIHRKVSELAGAKVLYSIENHHNFAWKEIHNGKEVIVHRKGATPAGVGVLGIIPGSMGTPGYLVTGFGNADSLNSASHGAGRVMSRRKAKEQFNFKSIRDELMANGIEIISAGADEVPGVYKDIEQVMKAQRDLVAILGSFRPKIVKMSNDGRNED